MSIIRSKIARQLLAEGGAPRKGFARGTAGSVGQETESFDDNFTGATSSPSSFGGFTGSPEMGGRGTADTYGFDQRGPAGDSDDNFIIQTLKNLGTSVGDRVRAIDKFINPNRDAINRARRRDFLIREGIIRSGPLGDEDLTVQGFTGDLASKAGLDFAKGKGYTTIDDMIKTEGGDNVPIRKLRAPIAEKKEPKDEFADILKFYGARFARGGSTGFEGSPEMGGRGTEETYGFDQSGPAGDSGDDGGPPTGPIVSGDGPTINVSGFGPMGRPAPTISKATRDKMIEDFLNLDTGPTTVATFGQQVPGGLLGEGKVTGATLTQPTNLDDLRQAAENVGRAISDPTSPLGEALDFGKAAVARDKELSERFGIGKADGGEVRQEYGLGSIVKKATRAVKKVVKSPIGKAALFATPFLFPAARAGGANFLAGLTKDKLMLRNFIDATTGAYKAGSFLSNPFVGITAASLLAGGLSKEDEEDEKLPTVANTDPEMTKFLEFYGGPRRFAAEGGMMEQDEMLDLGGKEMDLRGGGFVPLGEYEKKDDVPARLSKNEFVFTADAVRAAGGGSVDKGADVMYKTMKTLENKVA